MNPHDKYQQQIPPSSYWNSKALRSISSSEHSEQEDTIQNIHKPKTQQGSLHAKSLE